MTTGGTSRPKGMGRIAVVDDEAALADLFAVWLSDSYSVSTAYSGTEALELLDRGVDAILLDRRMPDMTGDEVLGRIRSERPRMPVALVSAVRPDFDLLELSFDEYLHKPVDRADLQTVVNRLLRRHTYDESLQEAARLQSKLAWLEAEKSQQSLEGRDTYVELRRRFDELQSEIEELPDPLVDVDSPWSIE